MGKVILVIWWYVSIEDKNLWIVLFIFCWCWCGGNLGSWGCGSFVWYFFLCSLKIFFIDCFIRYEFNEECVFGWVDGWNDCICIKFVNEWWIVSVVLLDFYKVKLISVGIF